MYTVLNKYKYLCFPPPGKGVRPVTAATLYAKGAAWVTFLPGPCGSAGLFSHLLFTKKHAWPLTHTHKVNSVLMSKPSFRKVRCLSEGAIKTWIFLTQSTFFCISKPPKDGVQQGAKSVC